MKNIIFSINFRLKKLFFPIQLLVYLDVIYIHLTKNIKKISVVHIKQKVNTMFTVHLQRNKSIQQTQFQYKNY